MNKGYVNDLNRKTMMMMYCEKVVKGSGDLVCLTSFKRFMCGDKQDELYIFNIEDLGFRLSQLLPFLEELSHTGRILHVVEKFPLVSLTDEEYFTYLLFVARNEKKVTKVRAEKSIQAAKELGEKIGRPRISEETILEIKNLHHYQKRTIREIAALCDVSIGTVHKYVKLNDDSA